MPRTSAHLVALAAAVGAATLLSACSEVRLRDAPDFGEAVRQDQAAAIADPDARYVGTPAPGSNGRRADLAQQRYVRNRVIAPTSGGTTDAGGGGGGGGGGGDSGGGGGSGGSSGGNP